jgi:hypothetical protein
MNLTLLLEIVSAVLGIVAIVFAITHTLHFRENATKVKSVTEELAVVTQRNTAMSETLTELAKTLPTHDIGEFPEYVGELAEMIGKAKHRIIVVCDVPCYCAFSDRTLWAKYWNALNEAKARGFDSKSPSISLTWMDSKCRTMVLEEQFDPNNSESWDRETVDYVSRCRRINRDRFDADLRQIRRDS